MSHLLEYDGSLLSHYVNMTTKRFLFLYVSALEALCYESVKIENADSFEKKEERLMKREGLKPKDAERLDRLKTRSLKRLHLNDLLKPCKSSTALVKVFDRIKFPYFDENGSLRYNSLNELITNSFDEVQQLTISFQSHEEALVILKGERLTKRRYKEAHFSLVREAYTDILCEFLSYFLCVLSRIRGYSSDELAGNYYKLFSKVSMPLLKLEMTYDGGNLQDCRFKTRNCPSNFIRILNRYHDYLQEKRTERPAYLTGVEKELYDAYQLDVFTLFHTRCCKPAK